MDILGVGPLELIVIMAIALIVVGPERLPEVARSIGKVWRQLHNMSRLVTAQWQEELSAAVQFDSEKKGLHEALVEPLQAARADIERALTGPMSAPVETKQDTSSPPTSLSALSSSELAGTAVAQTASAATEVVAGQLPSASGDASAEAAPQPDAPAVTEMEIHEQGPDAAVPLTSASDGTPEHGR